MKSGILSTFFAFVFLLNSGQAVAADMFRLHSGRPKKFIKLVVDDPNGPRPSVDDAGAVEDDDESNYESGTCRNCNIKVRSPLGPNESLVRLTTSALVRSAYLPYSESPEVTALIAAARNHIEENPTRYIGWRRVSGKLKKITYCYRAVKDALRAAGVIPADFTGGAEAKLAVADLAAAGFRNLLDDGNVRDILASNPQMAPKGAILVYNTVKGTRPSSAGHIEIKTEDAGVDGYISVTETEQPTYGYRIPEERRLIGVLIKDFTDTK